LYCTIGKVEEVTGFIVDEATILRAQAIVEVASGRPESAVSKQSDRGWLEYAVCWQAAYMSNSDVFEQANVSKVTQDRSTVEFGDRVFALSPLVVEAVKRLSWNKSRGIQLRGWNFRKNTLPDWWYW